ncbi:MAG: hypothetical protein ACLU9T_04145 [Blautia faecis]
MKVFRGVSSEASDSDITDTVLASIIAWETAVPLSYEACRHRLLNLAFVQPIAPNQGNGLQEMRFRQKRTHWLLPALTKEDIVAILQMAK